MEISQIGNIPQSKDPLTAPASHPSPEMKDLVQRLFRLKHRLRVALPENLATLKEHLHASAKGSNLGESNANFDVFFNLGSLLSRQNTPIAMGDLSRSLNVPLSSATRIVDWLVNNGYAQRLQDPEDRRVVLVALTEPGLALYREIDTFFMERVNRLLKDFTPDERITLRGLLLKIVNTLEQEDQI